ncbi:hypothetical protein DNM80_24720 [Salmonella enterica subsp. enterica]|nr:hypothetical protein [Salmonella enterica subsp. enterica serovar Typhimurium]
MLMTRLFQRFAAQTCGFNNHFQAGLTLLLNTFRRLFSSIFYAIVLKINHLYSGISATSMYTRKSSKLQGKMVMNGNWNRKRLDTKNLAKWHNREINMALSPKYM